MQVQPKHSGFFAMILRSAALFFPVVLVACSASNSSSNPLNNPPPVNAQTTYSNAALSGTYSIDVIAGPLGMSLNLSGLGTMQLDGNGNIVNTSFTVFATDGPNTCTYTGTGTYTLNSNASGNAKVTLSTTNSKCASALGGTGYFPAQPISLAIQAAQQGSSFLTNENDGLAANTVTALKQ